MKRGMGLFLVAVLLVLLVTSGITAIQGDYARASYQMTVALFLVLMAGGES